MNNITEVTKRAIIDIFVNGITIFETLLEFNTSQGLNSIEDFVNKKMAYCGRLEELEFLNRLYNLESMPSKDIRCKNAYEDIVQHTINNCDWVEDWVFYDNRFNLFKGEDDYLLRFLCEVFHPAVRNEAVPWQEFLNKINELLTCDGYILYEASQISGRTCYDWREINKGNKVVESQIESIRASFNTDYVGTQIDLMSNLIDTAPHSAIGKAKELLETCCKTILDEKVIDYPENIKLSQLMKLTCKNINLSVESTADDSKEGEILKSLFGSLSGVVGSISELRNSDGDGHGKSRDYQPLPPRFASLAVASSVAIVQFMWETFQEQAK